MNGRETIIFRFSQVHKKRCKADPFWTQLVMKVRTLEFHSAGHNNSIYSLFYFASHYIYYVYCSYNSPKYFAEEPSSLKTVTTPGRSTCSVGTWAGRIPKAPVNVGTSICFTLTSLKNTCSK